MGSSWEFGWDAVGTIVSVLAFLGFVIAEWEKIRKVMATSFIAYSFVFGGMFFVGISLLQASIFWRLSSLAVVGLYGAMIGSIIQDNANSYRRTNREYNYGRNYNKKVMTIILFLGLSGIFLGAWVASLWQAQFLQSQ